MNRSKKDVADVEGIEQSIPRMPHERDQSSDSQQGAPNEVIEKAYRDVEEGQQDTDRRGIHGYEKPENRILNDKAKHRAQPPEG